ncbi:MAG: transcription elongation factor GreA [Planctomycetota bacterium]|nr:transcription elongation factor GreA [Planctomycetota bacterium]
MSQTPMTPEGYDKLKAELKELEARRPTIQKAIAEAREKGDLKENADYHAAREELSLLEARVGMLSGKLADAVIVKPEDLPDGKVCLFRKVTFKRVKDKVTMTRTLVGEGEEDPKTGKILVGSPLGKALVGHAVGDVVEAQLPGGIMKMEILKIE